MVDALDQTRTPENREHTLTIPKVGVDVIVRDLLRGLDAGRFLIVPGWQTRWMAFGIRHAPAITRWIGDRRIRKVYRGPHSVDANQEAR
jgi:3-dehydrosphinganine reductase